LRLEIYPYRRYVKSTPADIVATMAFTFEVVGNAAAVAVAEEAVGVDEAVASAVFLAVVPAAALAAALTAVVEAAVAVDGDGRWRT
jgi:hypothetical protein